MIVASAWDVKVEWVEGDSLPISDRIPRPDIRRWQGLLNQSMHGVAVRKVPLATIDITKMVYSVASDTRLVWWCSRAYYLPVYSLSGRLSRVIGYYSEIALKLPPTQMTTRVGLNATCSSNPNDATCRVGCNIEMTLELSLLR